MFVNAVVDDVEVVVLKELSKKDMMGSARGPYSWEHVLVYQMKAPFLGCRAFTFTGFDETAILAVKHCQYP